MRKRGGEVEEGGRGICSPAAARIVQIAAFLKAVIRSLKRNNLFFTKKIIRTVKKSRICNLNNIVY